MSLFQLLGGGGGDFSTDSSSGIAGLGKDVIIDYGNTGNSHSCSFSSGGGEDDDDEDTGGYDGVEEEEEDEEDEGVGFHKIMKILEEDEYFVQFGLDFFYQFRDQIISSYTQFSYYSPLKKLPLVGQLYVENELLGLEYLMDPRRMRPTTTRPMIEFPKIFFTLEYPKICSTPIENLQDTFLVPRSFDYFFSYIIEMALLDHGGSKRLPDYMTKERAFQKEERMRLNQRNICHQKGDHLQCPFGWVLYTKSNGPLMKYCTEIQSRNKYIHYHHNEQYQNIMPLSFYLVQFLCGPLTNKEDHDFWISVPLYYLDIWESGKSLKI